MTEVVMAALGLVALKALIGYRFPWETCNCCQRKMREHQQT